MSRVLAQNLTNAIAALRSRHWAMHQTDKDLLVQARRDVVAQQPFVAQVQQALVGNTEGKTLANVTPTWVKNRLKTQAVPLEREGGSAQHARIQQAAPEYQYETRGL